MKGLTIFDLYELSEEELRERINEAQERHPILRELYSQEFIEDLLRNAKREIPSLVWYIASGSSYSEQFWKSVDEDLKALNLREVKGLESFIEKFKRVNKDDLESAKTMLEIAARFARECEDIWIEPTVQETGRKADLAIRRGKASEVYLEIKSVFSDKELTKMRKVEREIHKRLRRLRHKFVISVTITDRLEEKDIKEFERFVNRTLDTLEKQCDQPQFPRQYNFRGKATLSVVGRPRTKEHGYLGMVKYPAMLRHDIERFRRIVKSGVQQLPRNAAGVIYLDCSNTEFGDKIDMEDALHGNLTIIDNRLTGEMVRVRGGNRVFEPNMNRRLSAVVYYKRVLQGETWITKHIVYHNPYALIPLPIEFFGGDGVIHCRRIKLQDGTFELEYSQPDC